MHHFVSQEQFLLDRIRSASYRLQDISDKLAGPRPPEKSTSSITERPEPNGILFCLTEAQGNAANAVEVLHAEINRLAEILNLTDPGSPTNTKGIY